MDYQIDAKNKRFGRVITEIAQILQGKKSPNYDPRLIGSDRVILKNYKEMVISGNKAEQKIYYRHTGYVGHLKATKFRDAFAKSPQKVIREAVRRMLPKNSLAAKRLKNLIFE
jgi:large subunit ribosomal protein L13